MVFFWQNEVPVLGKAHGCNIHFRFYDVSVWNLNNFPTSELKKLAIVSLVFLWRCFFFKEFVCDQVSEFDVGTILLSSTAQLPFAFLFNLRSNLRSNWCKSRSGNPWLGQQSLRDGLLVLLHTLCEYGFQLRDDLLVLQIHPFLQCRIYIHSEYLLVLLHIWWIWIPRRMARRPPERGVGRRWICRIRRHICHKLRTCLK